MPRSSNILPVYFDYSLLSRKFMNDEKDMFDCMFACIHYCY